MISRESSKIITVIIYIIVGFTVLVDYYIVVPELTTFSTFFINLATVLTAFTIGLAALGLFRFHIPKILNRVEGEWYFSAWMVFVIIITTLSGVIGGGDNLIFQWIFNNIFSPLGATMFAMLGFFIVSAAYRVFRARSLDASILLLSGILVMLMNMPMGEFIWSYFPVIGTWVRGIPAMAGSRGISIALAVGGAAYSIRILIGYEKPGET